MRLRDDSGVAMVTAIMAGLVVLFLSTVGFQLATHNLDQSAGNRRSVQSVHASEAGLDRFLGHLANEAEIASPPCSLAEENLTTTPVTLFNVEATYYWNEALTGTSVGPSNCAFNPALGPPTYVVVRSVGTSASRTRTMETKVQLLPNNGSALSTLAVFAGGAATWTGQASISNAAGTELTADLYSALPLELKGGGTVNGYVESQSTITLSGQTEVKRDVTARGDLSIGNNAVVRGNARSSTASVSNGGTINGNAYYCTGGAPGGTVGGIKTSECQPSLPKVKAFKQIGFDAAAWSSATADPSYSIVTANSCSAAQTALQNLASGNYVVRANCNDLTIPAMEMKGHVAIIATGNIDGKGSTSITRAGTSPTWTLSLLANVPTSPSTASPSSCSNNSGISMAAGTTFPQNTDVLFYTPCAVKFTGNATSSIQGQIVAGGDVTFSSGSNITYKPILVPGTSSVGFRESVRYRSEVTD